MKVTVDVTDEPKDRPVTVTIQVGDEAEDETETPGSNAVVAGAQPVDVGYAPPQDALAQVDEQPEDRRRTGFTS